MSGYVLLRANPYMAKTDSDGRFEIKNLPVGQHVFRLWHERNGYLRDIRIGQLATDSRGRLTVTIVKGNNELREVHLAPELFEDRDRPP